ncbi:4Fe-4S binding protein [archaeon]|jgi:NAD-dependent dihydropyrimidine dehydrogenase PreA subunit|nr:4Fe-4S binding protein [archaeon]MBT4397692.1 4Fe-4S binding protein [archaeon]MBT4441612.1 4Fe-4S binding protein [archaeon]
MGHLTSKAYYNLQKRLDENPQSAPESKILFEILKMLFSEKEAKDAALLPLNIFTVKDASKLWKKNKIETKKELNQMADKGLLLDLYNGKEHYYFLAPPMVGFFELALMRTDGKFNEQVLSELLASYLDKDDEYLKKGISVYPLFYRVFVQEDTIKPKTLILDYEKAKKIISNSSCITLGRCYCRHKKEHEGKKCDFPQNTCMSFNKAAESLHKHGIAKKISKKKALENLNKCIKLGLVQIGDNVQENVNWICNCCSCCCEAIGFYKRYRAGIDLTSNFVAKNSMKNCTLCEVCIEKCPVDAIKINNSKNKYIKINKNICIGCAVCVNSCPNNNLNMIRKEKISPVPKDNFELMILEAIDKNRLQNYLFDGERSITHDILKKFVGFLLKLPPTKYALANQQLKSKFLNMLAKTDFYKNFREAYNKKDKPADYTHNELKVLEE